MAFDKAKFEIDFQDDISKQAFWRDNGRCRYCGLDFMSSLSVFYSYTIDHIVAKAVNGPHTLNNVVTACFSCNGALNRTSHLRTFEERKRYVESENLERIKVYQGWVEKFKNLGSNSLK